MAKTPNTKDLTDYVTEYRIPDTSTVIHRSHSGWTASDNSGTAPGPNPAAYQPARRLDRKGNWEGEPAYFRTPQEAIAAAVNRPANGNPPRRTVKPNSINLLDYAWVLKPGKDIYVTRTDKRLRVPHPSWTVTFSDPARDTRSRMLRQDGTTADRSVFEKNPTPFVFTDLATAVQAALIH